MIPNREVCKQAVGALLNLAMNTKVRVRIGFLGGIQVLLGKFHFRWHSKGNCAMFKMSNL